MQLARNNVRYRPVWSHTPHTCTNILLQIIQVCFLFVKVNYTDVESTSNQRTYIYAGIERYRSIEIMWIERTTMYTYARIERRHGRSIDHLEAPMAREYANSPPPWFLQRLFRWRPCCGDSGRPAPHHSGRTWSLVEGWTLCPSDPYLLKGRVICKDMILYIYSFVSSEILRMA